MDGQKEAALVAEQKKNVLENGAYSIYGPDNGDIMIDTLELHAGNGAKRILKVKSITKKEINLNARRNPRSKLIGQFSEDFRGGHTSRLREPLVLEALKNCKFLTIC